jgi:DNA invertase Pin-like site-specific DNA recombinase
VSIKRKRWQPSEDILRKDAERRERVRFILADRFNFNFAAMARATGVKHLTLKRGCSTKRHWNPTIAVICRIAAGSGVNYNWLVAGIGPYLIADGDGDEK